MTLVTHIVSACIACMQGLALTEHVNNNDAMKLQNTRRYKEVLEHSIKTHKSQANSIAAWDEILTPLYVPLERGDFFEITKLKPFVKELDGDRYELDIAYTYKNMLANMENEPGSECAKTSEAVMTQLRVALLKACIVLRPVSSSAYGMAMDGLLRKTGPEISDAIKKALSDFGINSGTVGVDVNEITKNLSSVQESVERGESINDVLNKTGIGGMLKKLMSGNKEEDEE